MQPFIVASLAHAALSLQGAEIFLRQLSVVNGKMGYKVADLGNFTLFEGCRIFFGTFIYCTVNGKLQGDAVNWKHNSL